MTIGERLREERERLKLTQPSIADAANTTKQTQHAYETNRTPPKASYLAAVAGLGVDVAYVITGVRLPNTASTPMEVALLDNYRASTPDVQRGVSKLLAETGKAVERANAISKNAKQGKPGQKGET